ncbi:MAG TPA: hypothetical protein VMZ28_15875, partial [Kofleriaceae bacterium]|nr:hypothetical protein [Kofleriaceae bacterium]
GKSSLCRAGVLPRIEQGALADDRRWQVVTMQPGRRPAFALAAALAPLAGGGGGEPLDTVVARVAQRVRRGGDADAIGLVLFVDQLEEMVTLAGDDEAEPFVAALLALSALPGGVRVLAAVRGDFATRVLARLGPGEEVARTLFVLRPLDEAGVRAAITQPAQAAGHRFESDAMVDALVEQASRLDGALPLLQFALAELWELRDPARGLLPASALEQVGGIAGIVARHADGALARLRPSVRAAARPLLLRLVTAERTRARRREEELLPEDAPADARAALEALIQARIVVARDGEEGAAYELTHEVLIRSWGTLGAWLDSDAERHAAEARVRTAAAEWERLGRPREELLGAAQLQEAAILDGVPLDAGAAAFLRASRGALRRRRLAWRGGIAAAFVLLASVAVALTYFNREATHQNEQARRHIVKLYTEQGRRALLDGHRQRALVYLAEAWRRGGRDPALRFLLRRAATALDQQQEVLRGHTDFVRDARFSPDGRTIATISDDRTARLWDTATGRERHVLRGHTDWVRAVAFSPDGRSLLTVSWDGTARLWDAASGRSRWVADLREGAAPPGDLHAVAGTLSLPCAADFSPDGARIVAGCVDHRVAVLARRDGAITARVAWEGGSVISAAFSPDGRRLVVTAFDGSVRLVESATGAAVASLVGHEGSVRSGAFSPDGTLVLTTGRDGAPRLWSADDGHTVAVLRGHQGPAGARFTPDGARILTTGVDRTVRVWDARDGHVVGVSHHHDGPVSAGDVSPDGRMFFSGDEAGIGVLSDVAGRRLAVFEGHTGLIWSARFAPDGSRVVTASQDGTARVWRVGGDAVVSLHEHQAAVTAVRFLSTGRRLFTASEDATIRDWRLSDDAAPTSTVFARDANGFLALAVTGDGRFLAAGGQGGTVRVWETATAREVRALRVGAAGAVVNAVAFDAAGALLATTSSDGMVRLWDVASGRRLAELRAHGGQDVFPVAFDATGTRFATGGNDGAARVWNARDRRELRALDHGDPIGYVAFCGDRLVVSSGATVRTWRLDGTQDATFAALGEAILAPTCPGDRIIVAGGRAVGVWDLHGGSQLENVGIGGADIFTVDVAAGGEIAVGTLDGTVTIVRLEVDTRSPEEEVELSRALPFELGDGGVIRLTR